ncbi:MAG: membrane protein insertase YidC [Gemmatimonadetes bacterium]|nr:membrane protein insertase YidC [Gemmatimonadota bacterium]
MTEQPGQEQRAFWAILLAMGVLIVWSVVFPPTSPPTSTDPEIAAGGETAGEVVGLREPEPAGPPKVQPPSDSGSLLGVVTGTGTLLSRPPDVVPTQRVKVESEDLHLTIDGLGARVVQAVIPAYPGAKGTTGPVQLVPETGAGALGSVVVVGGRETPLDQFPFKLVSDSRSTQGRQVVWEATLDQLTLRKTFIVPESGNVIRITQQLVDDRVGVEAWGLAWAGGLRVTEKQVSKQRGPYFEGAVLAEGKVQRKNERDFRKGPLEYPGHTYFVAVTNKYFMGAIVPQGEAQGPAKLWSAGAGRDGEASVGAEILVERTPGIAADQVDYSVYIGPMDFDELQATGLGIEKAMDLGWTWVRPLSELILKLIIWMHSIIPNYGVVIILFSILINVIFFPLTYKSTKSMRDMAALKPRMDELKEKYKDEPQKMSEATMKLYKEAGVNPLAGCLPLFLQMPIFFALYAVLFRTIELRQAPFFGWIQDLSQPDVVFHLPVALPFIGTGISLLPIIMGITSFFQTKATTVDPSQKAMIYMMPIMMTFIFFTMPSGLVLYWLMSNLFTIGQRAIMKPSPAAQATAGG